MAIAIAAALSFVSATVAGQVQNTGVYRMPSKPNAPPVPRMPDGKPDMQGYWEIDPAVNITAQLEEHETGFGIRASPRVIDTSDGTIPYQPWALKERDRRRHHDNAYEDPEGKCALAGVPHQMYVLFPVFQILQPPGAWLAVFEYVHAYRRVDLTRSRHLPDANRLWEGDSIGHWEGDTLVIDTTNLNGKPWLELYGDFIGPNAHVVERLTMRNANTIDYRAVINDLETFTRPWSISFSYFRGTNVTELYEQNCHETNVDLEHMRILYEQAHGIKSDHDKK